MEKCRADVQSFVCLLVGWFVCLFVFVCLFLNLLMYFCLRVCFVLVQNSNKRIPAVLRMPDGIPDLSDHYTDPNVHKDETSFKCSHSTYSY